MAAQDITLRIVSGEDAEELVEAASDERAAPPDASHGDAGGATAAAPPGGAGRATVDVPPGRGHATVDALPRDAGRVTVDAPPGDDDLARADVVLAVGWPAAPAVLRAAGVRARAVLATSAAAPLGELGWTGGIAVLGPSWLGGSLPGGTDAVYAPLPVHRREDLVLVHGDEPFGLLVAAELRRRRDDLSFAVSGVRQDLELPFPFLGVAAGSGALAHAFASATVAVAPPVRGWRPAAVAMLACGQAIVAPDDAATRTALGSFASFAADPLAAADAVESLLDDLPLRAERARAGFTHISSGWSATAAALAAALRALP